MTTAPLIELDGRAVGDTFDPTHNCVRHLDGAEMVEVGHVPDDVVEVREIERCHAGGIHNLAKALAEATTSERHPGDGASVRVLRPDPVGHAAAGSMLVPVRAIPGRGR